MFVRSQPQLLNREGTPSIIQHIDWLSEIPSLKERKYLRVFSIHFIYRTKIPAMKTKEPKNETVCRKLHSLTGITMTPPLHAATHTQALSEKSKTSQDHKLLHSLSVSLTRFQFSTSFFCMHSSSSGISKRGVV